MKSDVTNRKDIALMVDSFYKKANELKLRAANIARLMLHNIQTL